MGVLDRAAANRSQSPTFSRTPGGSRVDLILADMEAMPEHADDAAELRRRLASPNTEHSTKDLLADIRFVCSELDIEDRRLTYQNVQQWRNKARNET